MRMNFDEQRVIVHDVPAEPKVIIHDILSGDSAMNYRKVRHHVERTVKITEKSGLYFDVNYSSPVSKMVLTADRFESRIQLKALAKGKIADGKSPLQMAALGLRYGDELTICADGIDAQYAVNALAALVENNFDENKARREALDKTQFTMLGMSGSGKTCYLLGMYKKMVAGLEGFSFTTDSDTDVDLKNRYKRMKDTSLGQDRFPAGTDQTDLFEFTLEHALSPIMSFRWIDYPGGALEEQTSGNIEEYNKLEEYIKNSSSLFICVDGALLQGDDDNEEKIEAVQEECSSTINPFLSRYRKNNNFLPPTAIVVTKSDLCADLSDDDFREILEKLFSPLFVDGGGDFNRFVSVIPVSIGKNISENNYKGRLAPTRLQLPIFMGVWFALISQADAKRKKIDEHISQRDSAQKASDKESDSWFFWRDDAKIRRLNSLANELNHEIAEEQNRLNKALRDSDRLLNDLEKKVSVVYFNGEKYESFTRAAVEYVKTTPEYFDRK